MTVTRGPDGSLTASWPAVADATGYHVTYSSDGGGSWSLASEKNHPTNSITIGVDNAETYIVGVRARKRRRRQRLAQLRLRAALRAGFGPTSPSRTPAPKRADALTFTVTLDNAVPGGFTVTPSFTDGTATQGADYTANTAALSFAGTAGETRTFTVSTVEDDDVEANETFTVSLAVSGASASVTASGAGDRDHHERRQRRRRS